MNFETIRGEYERYRERLANRKDWDDSDTTPGLGGNWWGLGPGGSGGGLGGGG